MSDRALLPLQLPSPASVADQTLRRRIRACCTRGSLWTVQFAPRAHSTATLSVPDGPGTRTDIIYDQYSSRDTQPGPQTLSRPAAVQTAIWSRTHAKQTWSGVRPRGAEPGLREAAGTHPARMPYRTCTLARPGWSTVHSRRRRARRELLHGKLQATVLGGPLEPAQAAWIDALAHVW